MDVRYWLERISCFAINVTQLNEIHNYKIKLKSSQLIKDGSSIQHFYTNLFYESKWFHENTILQEL